MNAGEHGASGGHVALRVGERVYHYQHGPGGLLRLVRDDWTRFRRSYNDLENRSLRIAWIAVSAEDHERVRAHLARVHLAQRAQLDLLDALREEGAVIEALLEPAHGVAVRAAGLFDATGEATASGLALRAQVVDELSGEFLVAEARRVGEALRRRGLREPILPDEPLRVGAYPAWRAGLGRERMELLSLREALRVLRRAPPLAESALLPGAALDAAAGPLSFAERATLERFRDEIADAVRALLRSGRSDRGFPLLVAMARHRAVTRSLETGALRLLDPLPASGHRLEASEVRRARDTLVRIRDTAREAYRRTRASWLDGGPLRESDYNALELRAARFAEIERAVALGRPLRIASGRHVPQRSALRPPGPAPAPAQTLRRALEGVRHGREKLEARLRGLYRYELVRRNCATELVRALVGAFGSRAEAARALGGSLRPGEAASFIPFRLFDLVRERLRIAHLEEWPGLRLRELEDAYAREPDWRVYLREANTWSATLYRRRDADSAFLLFTDDVVWPRPVYGLVNTGFGLGQSAAGLLTAPFDGGRRFARGARGVAASLPELFFFNIRKGTMGHVEGESPF